jgi:hypothetical protein
MLFHSQEEITAVENMRDSSDHTEYSFGTLLDNQKGKKHSEDIRKYTISSSRTAFSFQIRTLMDGFNSGRTYYLHSNSADECKMVVGILRKFVDSARKRAQKYSKFRESQKWLRSIYDSSIFQLFSSFLIVLVPKTKHITPYRIDRPNPALHAEFRSQHRRGSNLRPRRRLRAGAEHIRHVPNLRLHGRARHQPLCELVPRVRLEPVELVRCDHRVLISHWSHAGGPESEGSAALSVLPRAQNLWETEGGRQDLLRAILRHTAHVRKKQREHTS